MTIGVGRVLVLFVLFLATGVQAQSYPAKPVRIVVGFAAGGSVDIVARLIAQKLGESLGQQFIVDNRAGAAGNIGANYVAHAAPDGHTLLLSSPTALASGVSVYKKLPFDPRRDFAPIVLVDRQPYVLIVHLSVPAKNVKEFIALAKSRPGKLNHGTTGVGSMAHMRAEYFSMYTGVNVTAVAYKGMALGTIALLSGEIDFLFDTVPTVVDYIKTGKVRALAVLSSQRVSLLPDIPTLHEEGFTGFNFVGWHGLSAPAGTPRNIIDKLNAEVNKALRTSDLRERFASLGLEVSGGSTEEFLAFIREEIDMYAKIVKASGMPLQ